MTREEARRILNMTPQELRLNDVSVEDEEQARQMAIDAFLEERPHGEWEWVTDDKYRCTNCGEIIQVKEVMNVPQYIACPMCEARMKEGDEK